jgi:hypothetical protein
MAKSKSKTKSRTQCIKEKKPKPQAKLGGKKAKFVCDKCGMKSRKKNEVCKPKEA